MDREIFERLENKLSPFNDVILRVDSYTPLSTLRLIVKEILIYLRNNDLAQDIFICKDWLQHDGVLLGKKKSCYKKIKGMFKDDEIFYKSRRGDHAVRNGYYDSNHQWYLRVYIVDEYNLKEGEDFCGDFDISIATPHIENIKSIIESRYKIELIIENAYGYFESINKR